MENDLKQPDLLPPVVFIESDYTDIPFGHSAPPNDDHVPYWLKQAGAEVRELA